MDQWQRQQYLEALGVDCLVPRFVLPGAKPSQRCQLPSGSVRQRAASGLVVTGPKPAGSDVTQRRSSTSASSVPSAFSATELLKNLHQESTSTTVSPNRSARHQAAKSDQPAKALSIQLLFARHSGGVLLVVPCPQGRLTSEEQRLFNDIQYALTADPADNWRYESFSWPVKNNRLRLAGEQAARDTLWSFFMARFKQADTGSCLLFGEQAVRYLYPVGGDWAAIRSGQIRLEQTDRQPLVTDALATMLENPTIKKSVWQQLKSLRSVITAGS